MTREEFKNNILRMLDDVYVAQEELVKVLLLAYDYGFAEGRKCDSQNQSLQAREAYKRGYNTGYTNG